MSDGTIDWTVLLGADAMKPIDGLVRHVVREVVVRLAVTRQRVRVKIGETMDEAGG